MNLSQKAILSFLTILLLSLSGFAHEPLYGLGPETLPKKMHAFELGSQFRLGELGYNFGYGYGISKDWTVRFVIPTIQKGGNFGLGNVTIITKYALFRKMKPGVLKRLTAIVNVNIPTADNTIGLAPNALATTIGIANGYESRRWYYFSDVGYTVIKSGDAIQPGNKLKYNLVGGIRPVKTDYLQPDLVVLIELNGAFSEKARLNGADIAPSGGNTLAISSGFLLSYRNIMLKAGMQIGIANTQYIPQPSANGLASLEYHF